MTSANKDASAATTSVTAMALDAADRAAAARDVLDPEDTNKTEDTLPAHANPAISSTVGLPFSATSTSRGSSVGSLAGKVMGAYVVGQSVGLVVVMKNGPSKLEEMMPGLYHTRRHAHRRGRCSGAASTGVAATAAETLASDFSGLILLVPSVQEHDIGQYLPLAPLHMLAETCGLCRNTAALARRRRCGGTSLRQASSLKI